MNSNSFCLVSASNLSLKLTLVVNIIVARWLSTSEMARKKGWHRVVVPLFYTARLKTTSHTVVFGDVFGWLLELWGIYQA